MTDYPLTFEAQWVLGPTFDLGFASVQNVWDSDPCHVSRAEIELVRVTGCDIQRERREVEKDGALTVLKTFCARP